MKILKFLRSFETKPLKGENVFGTSLCLDQTIKSKGVVILSRGKGIDLLDLFKFNKGFGTFFEVWTRRALPF